MHQIPTFQGFPVYRNNCPKCGTGGSVELVATIPKDSQSHYIACCHACPSNWKPGIDPAQAIENFQNGIVNE